VLLQNGEVKAVVGASGGAMIIAATSEVLLNHFVKGMDPFSSVTAPRFYHEVYNLTHVLLTFFSL
jgi:gamma-glutamyltranspeptidase/glutathione hydrolase/leukotriene-C4 hydrolase